MPLDDHPEAAVRFFSGVARYRATFGWSRPAEAVWLDLLDWRESDLGLLLDRIGFAAHIQGVGDDGESGADLPGCKVAGRRFSGSGGGG